jgi:hypothetical protein
MMSALHYAWRFRMLELGLDLDTAGEWMVLCDQRIHVLYDHPVYKQVESYVAPEATLASVLRMVGVE